MPVFPTDACIDPHGHASYSAPVHTHWRTRPSFRFEHGLTQHTAHILPAPLPAYRSPQYCPWKDHLYDLERESGCVGEVLYCVYQDDRDKSYRVQVCGRAGAARAGGGAWVAGTVPQ